MNSIVNTITKLSNNVNHIRYINNKYMWNVLVILSYTAAIVCNAKVKPHIQQ